jgi:cbb3-type cytochrome oxidase maturation protein
MGTYLIFTAIGAGLAVLGIAGVIWAVRQGQYDDLETPALRVLADDAPVTKRDRP